MSDTLQDLVDRAVFLSTETQARFGALIEDAEWDVDFSTSPSLTFRTDDPLVVRPHFIGSHAEAAHTWHWAWDNINDFPEPVVATAHELRRRAAGAGIEEMLSAEASAEDAEAPLRFALAAKELLGIWAHYPAAAGGGTTAWILVDDPAVSLDEPELKPVVLAIARGLTATTVADHRRALAAYITRRGLRAAGLPDGGIRLLFADGSADIEFDDQSRLTSCQAHPGLEGEAAEQFSAAVPGELPAEFASLAVPAAEAPARSAEVAEESVDSVPSEPATPAHAQDLESSPADETPVGAAAGEVPDAPEPVEAPVTESVSADEPENTEPPESSDQAPIAPMEEKQEHPSAEPAARPEAEPKREKKGFFRKLFGR